MGNYQGTDRREEIPSQIKWAMTFINRNGFPIVAFAVVSYICFVTLKEQSKAISSVNDTLIGVKGSIDSNTDAVKRLADAIYRTRNQ